jgi:hypothetical protein
MTVITGRGLTVDAFSPREFLMRCLASIKTTDGECSRGVTPIELVEGEKLVAMFETVGLGLKQKITFELDPQFFEQFKA